MSCQVTCMQNMLEVNFTNVQSTKSQLKKRRRRKRRHIPHSERPRSYVVRRNMRERRRVETVNAAFDELREHVPHIREEVKLPKTCILQEALRYINHLSMILDGEDRYSTNYAPHDDSFDFISTSSDTSSSVSAGEVDEQHLNRVVSRLQFSVTDEPVREKEQQTECSRNRVEKEDINEDLGECAYDGLVFRWLERHNFLFH